MTAREFAEGLVRCVRCAENWSQAPWSDIAGGMKVSEIFDKPLKDGTILTKMRIQVHTELAESEGEDGDLEFSPSKTEGFTIEITKDC